MALYRTVTSHKLWLYIPSTTKIYEWEQYAGRLKLSPKYQYKTNIYIDIYIQKERCKEGATNMSVDYVL